jgi:hypothetical protein
MITFTGVLSKQDAPEVVTITVTNSGGTSTILTAATAIDGSFSATEDLVPGEYTAVASVAATAVYTSAESDVVPFTVGLIARTITLTVNQ